MSSTQANPLRQKAVSNSQRTAPATSFASCASRNAALPPMMPRFGCLTTKQGRHLKLLVLSTDGCPTSHSLNQSCKTAHQKHPPIPPSLKYQVVLTCPESFFADTPAILAFEEKLSSSMPRTQTYDGYDTGSGTTNFIIYSNTPNAVLANFRKYIGTNKVEKKVRIA